MLLRRKLFIEAFKNSFIPVRRINFIYDKSDLGNKFYVYQKITQNLQLTGGLSVSYGSKGTEFGGFTLPGTDIRSKSPDNAYLWLIYYF